MLLAGFFFFAAPCKVPELIQSLVLRSYFVPKAFVSGSIKAIR